MQLSNFGLKLNHDEGTGVRYHGEGCQSLESLKTALKCRFSVLFFIFLFHLFVTLILGMLLIRLWVRVSCVHSQKGVSVSGSGSGLVSSFTVFFAISTKALRTWHIVAVQDVSRGFRWCCCRDCKYETLCKRVPTLIMPLKWVYIINSRVAGTRDLIAFVLLLLVRVLLHVVVVVVLVVFARQEILFRVLLESCKEYGNCLKAKNAFYFYSFSHFLRQPRALSKGRVCECVYMSVCICECVCVEFFDIANLSNESSFYWVLFHPICEHAKKFILLQIFWSVLLIGTWGAL